MPIMRFKMLGSSGLRVSELCLGTMTFGETWGWGASKDDSRAMFDYFAEQGGNFIDTSVNYTDGTSEAFIGEFLQGRRDQFVVATKYSLTKPDSDDPNSGGNSRKSMRRAVETSLRRLQTDHIDLYYLHAWDYLTPVEEVVRGLDDLVRAGKILYTAFSDTPAYIVAEANTMSHLRGWTPFIGMQVPYSLARRAIERDVLPMVKHWGMSVMPWGIIGAGVLTGKFMKPGDEPTRVNRATYEMDARVGQIVRAVEQVAGQVGRTMGQVAIRWVLEQQHRAPMIPILGARRLDQLKENMDVLSWKLEAEHLALLNEASQIEMGFPHDFIPGNKYLYGNTYDRIDPR